MDDLGVAITNFCKTSPLPVLLTIDEVDKSSNNQVFLNFLGLLRNKYLLRSAGKDTTFHSVILAGVYDVKNLKRKITGEEILSNTGERIYNSPWNIAADFLVDMSFAPTEIATMLVEYENDRHTGMDTAAISDELYRYTSGYPFLVSKLCKIIDERLDRDWTPDGVLRAVKILLDDDNTLFDDMFIKIKNNKALEELIFDVMINGMEIPFSSDQSTVELGKLFGILKNRNGKVAVANEIFEQRIANYFAAGIAMEKSNGNGVLKYDVVEDGKFNMALCLEKFSEHFYEIYSRNDEAFLEKHARMLFITYLKPLINGEGFFHIETQTRNSRRMDVLVTFGKQQFVVELKRWRGNKGHGDAYRQLWDYLDGKGLNEGYLLTFDFRKEGKEKKSEWAVYEGKKIFDVVV